MNQRLQGVLLGFGICALMLAAQAVVSDDQPKPKMPKGFCENMLPADWGQKTVLWIEPNKEGGMVLNYEKHQVVGYGMASVPESAN